ncbi:MAG: PIN domain-containing protein [Burkholderiales bacterium]|nr:PIN domain-containing protein [Phycisphaerae bacterium]
MNVIVDTSIWSLMLRRKRIVSIHVAELSRLVLADRAGILGLVRQEILSGLQHVEQFERVKKSLSGYPDIAIGTNQYELAAQFFNTCRSAGIQGSNVDFLICAVATSINAPIYSTDRDFELYARHLPIRLHAIGG